MSLYRGKSTNEADLVAGRYVGESEIVERLSKLEEDSGWINVKSFQNGAGNWQNGSSPVRYRKIGKIVYLNGLLASGTTGVQFTLPEGFRPSGKYNCFIVRYGTGTGRVFINYNSENGDVYIENAVKGNETSLMCISFIADN